MTQAKVYINDVCYVSSTESCSCEDCDINNYESSATCRKIQEYHNNCPGIIWVKQQPVETQSTTRNQTKGEPEMNTASKPTEVTAEEPKYTLAEFLEAYNVWGKMTDRYDEMGSVIKEYLEHKHLEYQEFLRIEKQYLELKQKFS